MTPTSEEDNTMKSELRQVVVAYDFSAAADAALERAIEIACRAPQHILHFLVVLDKNEAGKSSYQHADDVREELTQQLTKVFEGRQASEEVHFFVHTRLGKPGQTILTLAREVGADMVLVGTHGHTGVKRMLLGSVAETIVREAECPVIVCRPKSYDDVVLDTIVEVERGPEYVKPHRYSYHQSIVRHRPVEWPLN